MSKQINMHGSEDSADRSVKGGEGGGKASSKENKNQTRISMGRSEEERQRQI